MPGALRVNKGCPPPLITLADGTRQESTYPEDMTLNIGVANLTHALWEIEKWVRAVRETLELAKIDACIEVPPEKVGSILAFNPCECDPIAKTKCDEHNEKDERDAKIKAFLEFIKDFEPKIQTELKNYYVTLGK